MENLPEPDRPQPTSTLTIPPLTMKTSLGPSFPSAVTNLVTWFLENEGGFDESNLKIAVEEILTENGNMSDNALQNAIRERYAQKIYAVQQTPSIMLNPLDVDPRNSRYVKRYKFVPLTGASEIRLFKFSKFVTLGDQVHISCTIEHAHLDDKPNYTAISYVWGSLDDIMSVMIEDDKFLMVTRNLVEVLFRFSGANTPTDTGNTTHLLWTDQLCINQYDAEERGKQVALMRRIYTQAQKTKLWLGEDDDTSKQAFSLVRCFEDIEFSSSQAAMLMLTGLDADDIRERFFAAFPQAVGQIPPKSDPRWKVLFSFLDRPWFSRLWVFQEAILSANEATCSVVVGQMTCDFFHLYLARSLLFVDWEVESLPSGFQMVKHLMLFYLYRNLGILPPISFTVWQIGGCLRSQDPRDRIYGLLGVQDPERDIKLPIDYQKPVENVYIEFTRRCIEKDRSLRVLEFIKESPTKSILGLPSWVPDWSAEAITMPLEGSNLGHQRFSKFKASADRQHIDDQSGRAEDILAVKGKIIDQVVTEIEHDFQIGTPSQIEQYFSINFRVRIWVMFLEHGIERGLLNSATAEQLQAAVIRAITVDGYNDWLATQEFSEDYSRISDDEAIAIYHELEQLRELSVNGLPHDGSNRDLHRKIWVNTEICKGRRLAVLQKHWIMLGPAQAKKGDFIGIIHGSSIPWVLRPKGMGTYEVVGQCFVDGVMYGEAVDWTEDDAETLVLI
ncbi:uncharacterized protein PAC_15343 [Phialocephala subalpina]|uniref:Heterokaryon incompatibility domain-containing protein n=1 Tax=Phialocephala subalpina TaxID=576137 RepID=A0A1L7XKB1_9HELO|nr:uncharacterized protein PAC_15343 [Phialocephala subalpina]